MELDRLQRENERLKARVRLYESTSSGGISVSAAGTSRRFSTPGVAEMILRTDAAGETIASVNSRFASYFQVDADHVRGRPLTEVDRVPYAPKLFGTLIREARDNRKRMIEFNHESVNALTNGPRHLVLRAYCDDRACTLTVIDETRMRLLEDYFARYVSPHVLERLVDAPADFYHWRRVEVTAVACSLGGFVAEVQNLTPERIGEFVNPFHESVIGAAHALGGFIQQLSGDHVLIVFGAPLEREDHALQASACARRIIESHQEVLTQWTSAGLPPLQCRLGVAAGVALVGNLGDQRRSEYAALGFPTSLAPRLALAAPPSHVLLSWHAVDALKALSRKEGGKGLPKLSLQHVKNPVQIAPFGPVDAYLLLDVGHSPDWGAET